MGARPGHRAHRGTDRHHRDGHDIERQWQHGHCHHPARHPPDRHPDRPRAATKKTTPPSHHTDLQATVTDFTRAWLSGHDAKDKTRWVAQVSQWATKEHTYWLGLTSLEAIPDAGIASVNLPDSIGDLVLAEVHLTNGEALQVAALWDGEQWQINDIEPVT